MRCREKLLSEHGKVFRQTTGDPYMIFPKDLDAATGGDKTKEWQVEQEIADLRMRVVMLESMVEELQSAVRTQQYDIEELQIQVVIWLNVRRNLSVDCLCVEH